MRLMITDSGLGGLSVCAGLEQALSTAGRGNGVELLYINATPDDRIGYNALKTQPDRIELFNRFLIAVYEQFLPDEIAIACNTLSVIYADTDFARRDQVKVRGIVDAGIKQCNEKLQLFPDYGLLVFATETTTEADTYPKSIHIDSSRIVAQACPGLAHAISNDASGADCERLLTGYVDEALEKTEHKLTGALAFLGCTHYGYQTQVFRECLEARGVKTEILNPNDLLVQQLLAEIGRESDTATHPLKIRFISRYEIPRIEVESMLEYLQETAPLTRLALLDQVVYPGLF